MCSSNGIFYFWSWPCRFLIIFICIKSFGIFGNGCQWRVYGVPIPPLDQSIEGLLLGSLHGTCFFSRMQSAHGTPWDHSSIEYPLSHFVGPSGLHMLWNNLDMNGVDVVMLTNHPKCEIVGTLARQANALGLSVEIVHVSMRDLTIRNCFTVPKWPATRLSRHCQNERWS